LTELPKKLGSGESRQNGLRRVFSIGLTRDQAFIEASVSVTSLGRVTVGKRTSTNNTSANPLSFAEILAELIGAAN
jgi:hypothetical protein